MSLSVYVTAMAPTTVFDGGITHNLAPMAKRAGLYEALWRPKESGYLIAADLIRPLRDGIEQLRDAPDYFKTFNPVNGWGSYDDLLKFATDYLDACVKHPLGEIEVWR